MKLLQPTLKYAHQQIRKEHKSLQFSTTKVGQL